MGGSTQRRRSQRTSLVGLVEALSSLQVLSQVLISVQDQIFPAPQVLEANGEAGVFCVDSVRDGRLPGARGLFDGLAEISSTSAPTACRRSVLSPAACRRSACCCFQLRSTTFKTCTELMRDQESFVSPARVLRVQPWHPGTDFYSASIVPSSCLFHSCCVSNVSKKFDTVVDPCPTLLSQIFAALSLLLGFSLVSFATWELDAGPVAVLILHHCLLTSMLMLFRIQTLFASEDVRVCGSTAGVC